jgi:hypothetical protein
MFCSYVSDNRYGWVAFCEKQFGDVPSQICFEWNTPQHTTDDAVPPRRRAFTKTELQHMFDVVDDFVDETHRTGSKRWLTALRDSTAFKICYADGLRRRELVMLDLTDFGPNPHVASYGNFGALTVRPRMLRMTGRYADAWVPALIAPTDYAAGLDAVRSAAAARAAIPYRSKGPGKDSPSSAATATTSTRR